MIARGVLTATGTTTFPSPIPGLADVTQYNARLDLYLDTDWPSVISAPAVYAGRQYVNKNSIPVPGAVDTKANVLERMGRPGSTVTEGLRWETRVVSDEKQAGSISRYRNTSPLEADFITVYYHHTLYRFGEAVTPGSSFPWVHCIIELDATAQAALAPLFSPGVTPSHILWRGGTINLGVQLFVVSDQTARYEFTPPTPVSGGGLVWGPEGERLSCVPEYTGVSSRPVFREGDGVVGWTRSAGSFAYPQVINASVIRVVTGANNTFTQFSVPSSHYVEYEVIGLIDHTGAAITLVHNENIGSVAHVSGNTYSFTLGVTEIDIPMPANARWITSLVINTRLYTDAGLRSTSSQIFRNASGPVYGASFWYGPIIGQHVPNVIAKP